MADLTITSVKLESDQTPVTTGVPSTGLSIGQPLYRDTNGKLTPADNSTQAEAAVLGIALVPADTDKGVVYVSSGQINLGAILTKGVEYVLSVNAGKIAPASDLATGNWRTSIGIALSTSILELDIKVSNIQMP